jgi:hypothetical protein
LETEEPLPEAPEPLNPGRIPYLTTLPQPEAAVVVVVILLSPEETEDHREAVHIAMDHPVRVPLHQFKETMGRSEYQAGIIPEEAVVVLGPQLQEFKVAMEPQVQSQEHPSHEPAEDLVVRLSKLQPLGVTVAVVLGLAHQRQQHPEPQTPEEVAVAAIQVNQPEETEDLESLSSVI